MPQQSVSEKIERQLARAALEKTARGQRPTQTEACALRRIEKAEEEKRREAYYRTVPKADYIALSGRPTKILHDQADRYNLPLRGKTLDLYAVLSAFHKFLADNKHKLAATDGEDPMSGESSPALERWREEKYRLARLERLRQEDSLLPRDKIHTGMAAMANILRHLGAPMQRQYGPAAHQLVTEALDDWQRELDSLYGTGDDIAALADA